MPTLSLCSAYNCKNRSPKAGVGFFRFPKNDPERRKQWIINMKCKGWNPQQNHRVCSVHFEDKYICGRDIRRRLTPDAIPTIFDFPKNFQKKSITWAVKDVAPKVACENMEFQLPPLKHIIEITEAWEWLVIDIRGPLPLTLNGHQYVLTLTDFYSKWVEAFPLRGCSSTEVAQHVAEVISHFGFPFGILVRLKKNFTSKINVSLNSHLKLRGFSLLYRHRQVGSLDLATQTLISSMVSDLVNDHPYNWDVCLPAKVFSLCFKEHPKTKQRPFSLLCCKGPQPVTTPRDLSFSPAELRESSFAIQSNQEGGHDTDMQDMVGIESGKETAGKSTVTRVSFFRSNTESNSNTDGNIDSNPNTISNTDGNPNSNTDGNPNTISNTDGNPNTISNTDGNTDGNPNTISNTDGNPNTISNTDGNPSTISNTDGNPNTISNTDGNPNTISNTDGNPNTISNTDGNPNTISNTDGNPNTISNTDSNPNTISNTDGNPNTISNTDGNPSTISNTDGNPNTISNTDGNPNTISNTDGNPNTISNTDGNPNTISNTDGNPQHHQ
ncbi:hypothetical protein J4Q44_G00176950 [Coregonus suidteri]|uniref:THAP domain-containing protein 1 n=1 Tax=Coregonus suidteri TaxID=861788 RepID=A0AAN8M4H8_9TELE